MHSPLRLAQATLATGLLLVAGSAPATVVQSLSLEEKTQVAKLVVRAQVDAIETTWAAERAYLETKIVMRVLEALKGEVRAGQQLVLWQGGGERDGVTQRIPGTSSFTKGEVAILFLEQNSKGAWVEIGVGIGKYGVSGNGNEAVVTHRPTVTLAVSSPGEPMHLTPATPMEPKPLKRFTAEVRRYAKAAEQRAKKLFVPAKTAR